MSKKYTLNECIQIVNCCYFVGSCHSCPAHKHTGYANVVRCVGPKEVGEALLGILEPLSELEKAKKQPTLFEMDEGPDMDTAGADPVEAETIDGEEPDEEKAEEAYADEQAGTAEVIAQEIYETEVNEMFGGEE